MRSRRSWDSCPGRLNAFDTVIADTPSSAARVFMVTRAGTLFNVIERCPDTRPRRGTTAALLLLCAAQFAAVLDANALLVALPLVGRDLGLSGGGLQWVVTGYVIVYAGCLLAAGRVADAIG